VVPPQHNSVKHRRRPKRKNVTGTPARHGHRRQSRVYPNSPSVRPSPAGPTRESTPRWIAGSSPAMTPSVIQDWSKSATADFAQSGPHARFLSSAERQE